MTTGKYVTRGYQDIEVLGGITPDVLIKDADQQYQTALSWLKTQQALPDTFTFTTAVTRPRLAMRFSP